MFDVVSGASLFDPDLCTHVCAQYIPVTPVVSMVVASMHCVRALGFAVPQAVLSHWV